MKLSLILMTMIALNWAYFGMVNAFNIRGCNPAPKSTPRLFELKTALERLCTHLIS